MADVARVAGVSLPTVSRVLTGAVSVSPDKRARVLAAIEQLGYRPNAAARALVSGRRSLIAVLAGNTSLYGYARTISGIAGAARQAGYTVVIMVVESADPAVVDEALDLVLGQPVAGVIVLEFNDVGRAVVERLPQGIPVVSAGGRVRRDGQVRSVLIDEYAGGRAVTEYLLGLGHATVHHVAIPVLGGAPGRTEGWRDALAAAGAPVPEILRATWEPASGYRLGLELLGRLDVTAVFCGNDDLAIGVLRAFVENGVAVPQDVSVVGFDDQPFGAFWSPPLTTASQDFDDLGARAFASLQHDLDPAAAEDASSAVVATPTLVVRESAGPVGRGAAGRGS
ncbi:LacI family transcriptional regulator [Cellulomonas sp. WB94]|nr:LacI family transcriptional regulator [Cellulomonas sp. WB94]